MIPYFWSITLSRWKNIFLQLDLVVSFAAAILLAVVVGDSNLQDRYYTILRTTSVATVGLLGVILAGLALVVAYTNDDVLAASQRLGKGVVEDFFPFAWTALVSVLTTFTSVSFLIITPNNDVFVMRVGIALSVGLFSWTMFHMLSLVRTVVDYGVLRAESALRSRSNGEPGE